MFLGWLSRCSGAGEVKVWVYALGELGISESRSSSSKSSSGSEFSDEVVLKLRDIAVEGEKQRLRGFG
jgi:hypothetical protein